jgi:hypothetical protein
MPEGYSLRLLIWATLVTVVANLISALLLSPFTWTTSWQILIGRPEAGWPRFLNDFSLILLAILTILQFGWALHWKAFIDVVRGKAAATIRVKRAIRSSEAIAVFVGLVCWWVASASRPWPMWGRLLTAALLVGLQEYSLRIVKNAGDLLQEQLKLLTETAVKGF